MKFSLAILLTLPMAGSAYEGEWLTTKPARRRLQGDQLLRPTRKLQAELGEEVSFAGGVCPSLPANRVPSLTDVAVNDGWSLVDFCLEGATGSGSASPPECASNDDDSSSQVLTFMFDMFGTMVNKVFINNNGNLSIENILSTFTPEGFPIDTPMVAPFWADVDTGDQFDPPNALGRVWKKEIDASTFAVVWDHVGYYNEMGDKKNTFMVMISDGTNTDMGVGNNVCFCYEDMEWTTGSASGGVGGFNGSPATVGANSGDDVNFVQIGQYNMPGLGMSGVDTLDGFSTCFSLGGGNINPVPVGIPNNGVVMLECDETLVDLVISFAAPESSQTTSLTVDGVAAGVTVDIVDGVNAATATINWIDLPWPETTVSLVFTATDSAGGVTMVTLPLISGGRCDHGMDGDPHVKTWAPKKWFDYMGECDLVLLSAPNFDGLGNDMDIHTRTTVRYDYSYIESAAIQIGGDVLEVSSYGEYAINGVESGHLGSLAKYDLHHTEVNKKKHVFDIVLGPKENITISTYKDIVAVHLNTGANSAKYFGDSVGIMGSYSSGALLARDGVTEMADMNAFGQEWQVTSAEPKLFRTARAPQHPQECVLPSSSLKASSQRRLGETIAKEDAEAACGHVSSASMFDNCVRDVMAFGDVDFASTYNGASGYGAN